MEDQKMLKKRDFVAASITTYLILLILFFMNFDKSFENDCLFNDFCIRFCCRYGDTCTVNSLKEKFVMNVDDRFGILKGKPPCTLSTEPVEAEWNITLVWKNIFFLELVFQFFFFGSLPES